MEYSLYIVIISVFLPGSSFYPVVSTAEKGFVGGSAVLSCSIPECETKDNKTPINVHWRDNEGKVVFDIIGGNRTDEHQDSENKNRVETFPEEYKKCNFSIKLSGLQKRDEREYICYITEPYQYQTNTKLQVEDIPVGRGNHEEQRGGLTLTVSLLICFSLPVILRYI